MAGPATFSFSGTTGSLRTNYARIGHAAQQVFPEFLQEILALKEPPSKLHSDILTNQFLSQPRNLRPDEWSMLNSARTRGYVNFDIPLSYKLIRNLNLVPPPTQGWDYRFDPTSTETTPGDDIERIRRVRNKILHRGNANVSCQELKDYFNVFKDIAKRLELYLGKSKGEFVNTITELETCSMDEITEKEYLESFESLKKREEDLSTKVDTVQENVVTVQVNVERVEENLSTIQGSVTSIRENVSTIQGNVSTIQGNVSTMNEKMITVQEKVYSNSYQDSICEKWQTEDKYFVKTDAVDVILKSLKENHVFCTTGISGIGKSATIQHVALWLQDNKEYQIFQCFHPSDILEKYYREGKLVFVFDDVCGKFYLYQHCVEDWIKWNDSINSVIASGNIKILATCRSQVFQEKQFQRIKLFTQNICDLSSPEYFLFADMRLQIAKQYLPANVIDCIKNELMTFEFLPFMFWLYKSRSKTSTIVDAKSFFKNPFKIYNDEMNELKDANIKTKFCALFLLVVNNDSIKSSALLNKESVDDRDTRTDIFDECGIARCTPRQRIKEELDCLCDLFLQKPDESVTGNMYTSIHDKMFDFLCSYFGEHLQKAFIKYADSEVLYQRTQFKCFEKLVPEFNILIDEENENLYLERIVKDASLGSVHVADFYFQSGNKEFRLKLVQYIQNLDVDILRKTVSLSNRNGSSLLTFACKTGDFNLVRLLIEQGASVNPDDAEDETPLIAYLHYIFDDNLIEHNAIVKLFLDKGANVKGKMGKYGKYPLTLYLCCVRNDLSFSFDELSHKIKHEIFDLVHELVDKGANVNTCEKFQNTPLTIACQIGDIDLVTLLLEKGADVYPVYENQYDSPLTAALNMRCDTDSRCEIIKLLIDRGVDINEYPLSQFLRIMCSCISCDDWNTDEMNNETIRLLLKKGVNIDKVENGISALDFFMMIMFDDELLYKIPDEVDYEIFEMLLDRGANCNTIYDPSNGKTILSEACEVGDIRVLNLLINHGAVVDSDNENFITSNLKAKHFGNNVSREQCEIVELLLERAKANSGDHTQYSTYDIRRMVRFLIERVCEKSHGINKRNKSPLTEACNWDLKRNTYVKIKIIKMLLDKGVNVNKIDQCEEYPLISFLNGDTFYNYKENEKKIDIIIRVILNLLLERGANINIVDRFGTTPLMIACQKGYIGFVKLLLQKGADVYLGNNDLDKTVLAKALALRHDTNAYNQNEIIKLLIDKGANVTNYPIVLYLQNMYDHFLNPKVTPTEINYETIKLLIENGANVKTIDNNGMSPTTLFLKIMLLNGRVYIKISNEYETFKLLLDKGANINTADEYNNTPLSIACQIGNIRWIKLLIEKGADVNSDNENVITSCLKATHCGNDVTHEQCEIVDLLLDRENESGKVSEGEWQAISLFKIRSLVQYIIKRGYDDIHNHTNDSQTALAESSTLNIVKRLLYKIADVKESPQTTAFKVANINLIKFLMKNGADGTILLFKMINFFSIDYDFFEVLLYKGSNVNAIDENRETLLTLACGIGDITLMKILIEKGAKLDYHNTNIVTVYIKEKHLGNDVTHEQNIIVQLLLDRANELRTNKPLRMAQRDVMTMVRFLIKRSYHVIDDNETALTEACSLEIDSEFDMQNEIIRIVLDKGANIDKLDKNGISPLGTACRFNNIHLVKFLIENGANVNLSLFETIDMWFDKVDNEIIELLLDH